MQTPAMPEAALVRELLLSMKRIRAVDEAIVERYPRGEMRCPTHLSIGQEAVPAAAGCVLRHEDFAVSTHRSHGHYVGKGGDLGRMVAEIFGKRTGCSAGKGGSMHLIDPAVGFMGSTAIVGGTIPVGVGLGLSIKLQETDRVSCVFLGDAAVEEGVFAESLNFAVLKQLPVLFVCENNLYSVYSPLRVRQPQGRAIHRMAEGFGIAVAAGDGNDALGACALLRAAVAAIRNGEGPRFLEFATYRWREHCGPHFDNDLGYRTEEEFLAWKQKDPVRRLAEHALRELILTPAELEQLDRQVLGEVAAAFAFAEASPFPEPSEMETDVYAPSPEGC